MEIRRRLAAKAMQICLVASIVMSGSFVLAVSGQPADPAAAAGGGGPKQAVDWIGNTTKVFGSGSKLFGVLTGSKALEPWAAGLDFVAALGVPFLSSLWTTDPGPSIQDVLDKLDEMSQQLNEIQQQLNAVQAQLQVLTSDVQHGICSNLAANLNPTLASIDGAQIDFEQLVQEESELPTAVNPTAKARTIQQSFASFANHVLGPNDDILIGQSPFGQSISLINTSLLNPSAGLAQGMIGACANFALTNWRQTTPKNDQRFDDRGYYEQITNFVRVYQTYEVNAMNFIEEAAYFRASQLLHAEHPSLTIPVDQRASVCQLAHEQAPDESADQLCKNVKAYLTTTYKDLVAQWTFTGRPYSNGTVVLSLPSSAYGGTTPVKAVLWVRNPSALPEKMRRGTWETTTVPNDPIVGFTGWKPSSLDDWNGLVTSERALGNATNHDGILADLEGTGQFQNLYDPAAGRFYWIPGASASYRWYLGQAHTESGFDPVTEYKGPDIEVRCFVSSVNASGDHGSGIACSPDWWAQQSLQLVQQGRIGDEGANLWEISAYYSVPAAQWVPNPYSGNGKSTTDRWTRDDYHPCGVEGNPTCPLDLVDWNAQSAVAQPQGRPFTSLTAALMPTIDVPTAPACTNSIGLPKLCTANGDGYNDSAFTAWLNGTIPNPDQPSPVPTAQPKMTQDWNATRCLPAAWSGATATSGAAVAGDTTWTALFPTANASGQTVSTVVVGADQYLETSTIASNNGFDPGQPFRLQCTVTARWANLANSGSAQSTLFQVTPDQAGASGAYVLTQVPSAPTITSATVKFAGHVDIDFAPGDSYGYTVNQVTVTAYVEKNGAWRPQKSLTWGVEPGATTVRTQADPGTYRFTVSQNTVAGHGQLPVVGQASALSNTVVVSSP